jgi:hypothetical protein
LWVIGDEIRCEEIEGKRKPKNPFVICEKETCFILLRFCVMFVHELHFDIEFVILEGTL